VAQEQLAAYGLVEKVGRGVVSCGMHSIDIMQQQQQHWLRLLARCRGAAGCVWPGREGWAHSGELRWAMVLIACSSSSSSSG
jgi:hypothetical protein